MSFLRFERLFLRNEQFIQTICCSFAARNDYNSNITIMNPQTNLDAWDCLDQALFVSSHVSAKDAAAGETDWENVYPVSEDEIDTMEDLINQAEQKADDPTESNYRTRVNELRDVISYSRAKHRTWKWSLIFGAIISACIMWYYGMDNQDRANREAKDITLIESWQKQDTVISFAKLSTKTEDVYSTRYVSANKFKENKLRQLKQFYEYNNSQAVRYKQSADTASTADRKKSRLEYAEQYQKKAEDNKANFDKVAKMKFDELKDLALKEKENAVDNIQGSATKLYAFMVYLIILIPLYIISGYPYGYMIYRHRRQHGIMRKLRKVGFAIASFFFGTGLLMNLLPDDIVKYTYSNGRTETREEANPSNLIIVAIKIGLMIAGVVIFCFVSVLIMTVETITGLKRNFDWSPVVAKVKSMFK